MKCRRVAELTASLLEHLLASSNHRVIDVAPRRHAQRVKIEVDIGHIGVTDFDSIVRGDLRLALCDVVREAMVGDAEVG